jgi:perosamine synthetase
VTDEPIPFHRADIGRDERAAVLRVLESGWLTTGPEVAAFEEEFASAVGAPHAIAVASATGALRIAFEALGVGRDDEVIVPTYTFAASAETILYPGAKPVLVDVDRQTGNIDPASLGAAVTERTKAVEVVHVGGLPVDWSTVAATLADASGRTGQAPPPIVEDVAHAFPSPVAAAGGRFAGTLGAVGAFSFYATKTITTGEGGMFVTADDGLAARARSMRLHGIGRDAWKRYSAAGTWYYEIEEAGFKENLSDLAASIGRVQLARADDLKRQRVEIAERYRDCLAALSDDGRLILPREGQGDEHAWHLFVIRLTGAQARAADDDEPGVRILPRPLRPLAARRARVIERLKRAGVSTSVHFIPLHLHPLYRSMGYRPGDLPNAERAYAGAISLPIWPGMTMSQVDRVSAAVTSALDAET